MITVISEIIEWGEREREKQLKALSSELSSGMYCHVK
jgi:hypothetical protein